MKIRQRLLRTFILSLIGLGIGAAIAGVMVLSERGSKPAPAAFLDAAGLGGSYTLTDQNGKTRSEKDFADKYKLIYFGFTYCPAICPTELQKIAAALHELPKATQDKIQPIFITIDPERDTVDTMKNYVPLFMPNLIGLTGTRAQIDAVKSEFKVYAAKVPQADDPQGDDYTMDHSSYIYFMTPDDKVIALFKTGDTAETMVNRIQAQIK